MKRMTKRDEHLATQEMLERLRSFPAGLRTSQLIGTRRFHGERTLTAKQVARLLRASGEADHSYEGAGYMAASWWKLKRSDTNEARGT